MFDVGDVEVVSSQDFNMAQYSSSVMVGEIILGFDMYFRLSIRSCVSSGMSDLCKCSGFWVSSLELVSSSTSSSLGRRTGVLSVESVGLGCVISMLGPCGSGDGCKNVP